MVVAFPSYVFPLFAFGCLLATGSAFLCGGGGYALDKYAKITITKHVDGGPPPRFCGRASLVKGITTTTTSSVMPNTAVFKNQMISTTGVEPNFPTTPEGIEEMFENLSDKEIRELYESWTLDSMIDVDHQRNAEDPAAREKSEEMAENDWYRPSAFGTHDDPFAGIAPGATAPFKQDIAKGAMEMVEAAANLGEPIISLSGYDVTPQVYNYTVAYDGTVLNDVQRNVLWQRESELAFSGETVNGYKWDTKEDGTWVSAVSGIPLFSTEMKYDSGTGWPTFASPIDVNHFDERNLETFKHWRQWEILDKKSGTHLGYMFEDGPRPFETRYNMNAAALIFIPRGQALPVSQVKTKNNET